MIAVLKRYRAFLALSGVGVALLFLAPDTGWKALSITEANVWEMLSFLPPIFVLLGLLDVWVDRETMMKYMGDNSGLRGMVLAFILGSAAAGPLYAAFPLAGVMMKKGARLLNVFIFIGAAACVQYCRYLCHCQNSGQGSPQGGPGYSRYLKSIRMTAYDELTSEELMSLVASGDKRAFSCLMARHRNAVYGIVYHFFKTPQEAEDAHGAIQHLAVYGDGQPMQKRTCFIMAAQGAAARFVLGG